MQIKKFSSPYRLQTNGLVERTNQSLIAILAKNAHQNQEKWDPYLDIICFNYNIKFQESLGCSPFELLFGRLPFLPYVDNHKNKQKEKAWKEAKECKKYKSKRC